MQADDPSDWGSNVGWVRCIHESRRREKKSTTRRGKQREESERKQVGRQQPGQEKKTRTAPHVEEAGREEREIARPAETGGDSIVVRNLSQVTW